MRAHPTGVGAEVSLRQAEAADRVASRHARQPLLLLLLGPECVDRVHRQRALHADERTDAGVAGLELEARQTVGNGRCPLAAVSLQVHAQHAEGAEVLRQFTRRDLALLEPVRDVRPDLGVDVLAHHVADRALLLGQQVVDREQAEGRLRRAGHGSSWCG